MLVFEDRGNWRTQRKVSWGQIKCKNQQSIYSQPTYGITSSILLVGYCPPGCTILTQISIIIVARVIVVVLLQAVIERWGPEISPATL